MQEEYAELRISRIHLFKGAAFGIVSAALVAYCLIVSPREYTALILFFTCMLLYSLYIVMDQVNWYIRYDEGSFQVRNFLGKVRTHSYDEIKDIKLLRKGAIIISMKGSRKQYEIEPKIEGLEDFLEILKSYGNIK